MGDRRMLNSKITNDDSFIKLDASAQALYLHLVMSCDDDGFTNEVFTSQFRAHASDKDLQALIESELIYRFSNGVVVIRHWRMANALRKDRYKPTVYQEEIKQLQLNGEIYCLVATWLPDGCQVVAPSKDKLSKDNINNSIEKTEEPSYQDVVELYHQICVSYPKIRKLSDSRKKSIRARMKEYTLDDFNQLFTMAEESEFLKGNNNTKWKATFDWLLNANNIPKVLEGNYANRSNNAEDKNKFNNFSQRKYDYDDLERKLLSGN